MALVYPFKRDDVLDMTVEQITGYLEAAKSGRPSSPSQIRFSSRAEAIAWQRAQRGQ